MEWLQSLIEFMSYLVKSYGYLGVFVVMAISSASIILPVPGYLVVLIAGPFLNPILVALAAGFGATLGELTSYLLGQGGRKILGESRDLETAQLIYSRYGLWTIFLFAATPLPFDLIGIICGALKVYLRRFLLLTLAGKIALYLVLAETGTKTFDAVQELMAGRLSLSTIILLTIALASIMLPFIYWRYMVRNRSTASGRTAHLSQDDNVILEFVYSDRILRHRVKTCIWFTGHVHKLVERALIIHILGSLPPFRLLSSAHSRFKSVR
ncbi:VTT domain-containing protein [Candidatus Bathyarchaeota archaeon]|nr:VTT domain-containing protein [Candidatus Bathyarchaeota archaeon]